MRRQSRFPALPVAVWIMAGSMVIEAHASEGRGGDDMVRLLKGINLTIPGDDRRRRKAYGPAGKDVERSAAGFDPGSANDCKK